VLILTSAKIQVEVNQLTDMIRKREKNKHTLVYYLFLKKSLHNELTPEELEVIEAEEKRAKDALQSTDESIKKKPDKKKKIALGAKLKVVSKEGIEVFAVEPEPAAGQMPSIRKASNPLEPKKTLRPKKKTVAEASVEAEESAVRPSQLDMEGRAYQT
jgi:hypothetical protein